MLIGHSDHHSTSRLTILVTASRTSLLSTYRERFPPELTRLLSPLLRARRASKGGYRATPYLLLVSDRPCYPPTFTSHSFVYTDPVGFSSLFISVMASTAIDPADTGLSNTPDLAKI